MIQIDNVSFPYFDFKIDFSFKYNSIFCSFEDIIELNSGNNPCLIDTSLPQSRHISNEYSNMNMMQHPTIAEELEAVSYQNDVEGSTLADVNQSESKQINAN